MRAATDESVEQRIPISAARDGDIELLALAHETLAPLADIRRDGDFLCLLRGPAPGRPVRDGRVPRDLVPQLLLQAAAAMAFFQAHGLSLAEEDLAGARWDRQAGAARLWLCTAPALLRAGAAPPPCATLADLLDRLASRGGRRGDRAVRNLRARLRGQESALRRAEYALAAVLQSFPALAEEAAAAGRRRCAGQAGPFLRDLRARALVEKGRALLEGRAARLFLPPVSALQAGGALGIDPPALSAAEASRRLRRLAEEDASPGRAAWIAAAPERWDALSRRAFETAARFHPRQIEVRTLPAKIPGPRLPDQWRREIFVPCGSIAASLRFYEWFADEVRSDPAAARDVALDCLASPGWAAFASDPTGQAPLPRGGSSSPAPVPAPGAAEREVLAWLASREGPSPGAEVAEACGRAARAVLLRLAEKGLAEAVPPGWRATASGRRAAPTGAEAAALCRGWAARQARPDRRVELLLQAGEEGEALAEAERWVRGSPDRPAEAWFELAARMRTAGVEHRPWLDAIEAEREIAGGRPAEAIALLEGIASSPGATRHERCAALLREAEVCARVDGSGEAERRAADWRREFPEAEPAEILRALRLEAAGLARCGRHEEARTRLAEGDRLAAALPETARIEQALARASALSFEGRLAEEARLYDAWRARALAQGDEALVARFLSQEALGLCDARRFAEAAARLEQGLDVLRDDPAERARLSIDLAATLYHAGRTSRCAELLDEGAQLAAFSGRRDLLRVARSNRIELRLVAGEWDEAARAVEELLEAARADSDDLWLLVAFHHRARLALRRGWLGQAREDNARARDLALRLRDRLEVGELWLEEGDRLLYEEDLAGARAAWEKAAADPPDRCDTERLAAARLEALAWSRNGGPPAAERAALSAALARGEYSAAETAARWRMLLGAEGLGAELAERAERVLRERGGEALADRVFGARTAPVVTAALPIETLRALREALARSLAGQDGAAESLEVLGIEGLHLRDETGRPILRLGRLSDGDARELALEAGSVSYRLSLPRSTPAALASAAALLAETLLFRPPAASAVEGFAGAWRRLGIVTEDPSMEEPYRRLQRFAAQPVTVLVCGESGSGKEAVARAVHALSPRASGPFVAVNVPAIPAALLESELFGHVRGAFTGAERDRVGLLEEAARGTIFFDEIGDLESSLQSKLLRALQDREIRRLGDNRSRRIDVRVVSATARDLSREVEAGRFREDLFYRLHVAVIALPPLRGRGRDVLALARHFLQGFGREYARGPLRLSPEAAAALSAHAWPGNVRELQNAMAQAAALADADGLIGLTHLPEALVPRRADAPARSYRYRLDAHRKGMISDALERAGGNRSLAARELGLSRQALRYLMKELHVVSPSAPGLRPPRV